MTIPGGAGPALAEAWRLGLRAAFPSALGDFVDRSVGILDEPIHGIMPMGEVVVNVADETLVIPYRIYSPEEDREAFEALADDARVVLHTLLTRHHDGRVRGVTSIRSFGLARSGWLLSSFNFSASPSSRFTCESSRNSRTYSDPQKQRASPIARSSTPMGGSCV